MTTDQLGKALCQTHYMHRTKNRACYQQLVPWTWAGRGTIDSRRENNCMARVQLLEQPELGIHGLDPRCGRAVVARIRDQHHVQQRHIISGASVLIPKISTVAAVYPSRASVVCWLNSQLPPSSPAHAADAAEEETLPCFLALPPLSRTG